MAYLIYGIDVASAKDPERRATEWFRSRAERDDFLGWYKDHGRDALAVEKPDPYEQLRREATAHRRALEVARAGRPIHYGGGRGGGKTASAGLGFGAGLAIGLLF